VTAVIEPTTAAVEVRVEDVEIGEGQHLRVNFAGNPELPAVLMLHGSGPGVTASSNWKQVMETIGGECYCIAPDILGFGESSYPDPQPQGFAAQAAVRIDALLRLLDTLQVEKVTLVGNSMGGMYSLRMAQLRPSLVQAIVLMGSGGMPNLQLSPAMIKLVTFFDDPSVEKMTELLTEFVYDKATFGGKAEDVAAQRMPIVQKPHIEAGHRAMFQPEFLTYTPEELNAIDVPALVIHGRNDVVVPIESSYYLSQHLPQADLVVMNHCGHWTQIEQAERFSSMLVDFLRREL
jgi:2-hydroxymuconate-semialdehyde hydrolase